MVTKTQIEKILKTIPDPELGISVWDLGLIYKVKISTNGNVIILMTLTSVGCPLFDLMADPMKEKVKKTKGVRW